MKFVCIGDEDTARGFRLAGIEGLEAGTADEARAALLRTAAHPDCGIIIITEQAAAWVRREMEQIRVEQGRPLIVEIAGPEGSPAERRSLSDFVREAVGMSVE